MQYKRQHKGAFGTLIGYMHCFDPYEELRHGFNNRKAYSPLSINLQFKQI